MPFTFAHPAAAVPLACHLGRYGVLSALVIGSITPDLVYVLPFPVARSESHGVTGLLWFCLPAGLVSYVLFHSLLKGPLLGLLPPFALSRMGAHAARFRSLPSVPWAAVIVSLLCGAATHSLWDSLTHRDAPAVKALPMLQTHLFSVGAYSVHVYKLLQHGSTCVGLLLLAWWLWRWLEHAPVNATPLPVTLSPLQRLLVASMIVLLTTAVGLWAGMQTLGSLTGVLALQAFAGTAVFSALPAFALVVTVYSVGWHFWRWFITLKHRAESSYDN